ncbi:MAG: hypothetical protein L0H70_06180, partial [Xanthomonadales bacterium]|nr:hypothetical protein [Xanthomonadales bacterium]
PKKAAKKASKKAAKKTVAKRIINLTAPDKSRRQLAEEQSAAKNRRDISREQAAADFLALVQEKNRKSRQGPTWPVDSVHAGRLAHAGVHHEPHGHDTPAKPTAGSTTTRDRLTQPKRGQR